MSNSNDGARVPCGQVHLRLYLAITSLEPLRVLLFRDGLVLFANAKYDLSEDALQSKHVHLTNAAIAHPANKKGTKLKSSSQDQLEAEYDNGGDDARSWLTCALNSCALECTDADLGRLALLNGCLLVISWSLRPFLEHLKGEGVDTSGVWGNVKSALVKTVLTAQALQVRSCDILLAASQTIVSRSNLDSAVAAA